VDVVQDLLAQAGGWGGHTSVCRAQKNRARWGGGWLGGLWGGVVEGHYGG
jgi:hypothetical protein